MTAQSDITLSRTAVTAVPLLAELAERWSPRAFDPEYALADDELLALVEAARWAPSAGNSQHRRIAVALRGTPEFGQIVDALAEGNRGWAVRASALVVSVAVTGGQMERWAEYDAGQAIAHLSVQAHAMGLAVHQMGGFSPAMLAETFGLADGDVPVTVTAVGRIGSLDLLDERQQARETADRVRVPLEEFALIAR